MMTTTTSHLPLVLSPRLRAAHVLPPPPLRRAAQVLCGSSGGRGQCGQHDATRAHTQLHLRSRACVAALHPSLAPTILRRQNTTLPASSPHRQPAPAAPNYSPPSQLTPPTNNKCAPPYLLLICPCVQRPHAKADHPFKLSISGPQAPPLLCGMKPQGQHAGAQACGWKDGRVGGWVGCGITTLREVTCLPRTAKLRYPEQDPGTP